MKKTLALALILVTAASLILAATAFAQQTYQTPPTQTGPTETTPAATAPTTTTPSTSTGAGTTSTDGAKQATGLPLLLPVLGAGAVGAGAFCWKKSS